MPSPCLILPYDSYATTIPALLEGVGAPAILARQGRILIKPNLVNDAPPPVTLPVTACATLVRCCRRWSRAHIVIAEGTGEKHQTTDEIFAVHGYDQLAREEGIELVDLNEAELVELRDQRNEIFPSFMMPRLVMESFVLSAAMLKAHSLATVTLSMKNMIGVAPPAHYQQDGYWKKSFFHQHMQRSILELNRYRRPDLAFIDASVGLADFHLGGPTCEPPVGKLLAGFDPVAVDAAGAALLGVSWRQVGHIALADGELGYAEPPA